MFIVCYYLFFFTHSSLVKYSIGSWAYQSLVIAMCFLCLVLFGSGNVALANFHINDINKGRWTQGELKIFMQEYEKFGNNCMQIAKVLRTQTPAQIKKHAECFLFKQANRGCAVEAFFGGFWCINKKGVTLCRLRISEKKEILCKLTKL
jgi:hypothetical protein